MSRCPLLSPPSSPAPHVSIERGPEFAGTMLSGLKRGPESGSDILCRWLELSLLRGWRTITMDGQDFLLMAYFATSTGMMMMIINIQHLLFVAVWLTVQSISALFASIYYWLNGNFNETKIPGQSPLVWIGWSSCLFTRQEECHKEHSGAELHYYAARPRALLTICSALGTCIGTCALSKNCRRSDWALLTSRWSLSWERLHCTRFEQNWLHKCICHHSELPGPPSK